MGTNFVTPLTEVMFVGTKFCEKDNISKVFADI